MGPRALRTLLLTATAIFAVQAANGQAKSVYTALDVDKCRTIDATVEGAGSYRGVCDGVGGYEIEVTEYDLRQNVRVITPEGDRHDLQFPRITMAFSAVGQRAEWRVRDKKPYALIIRFNANENVNDPSKITSYLVVSKITEADICVVDVIGPRRSQNLIARRAADSARQTPCKFTDADDSRASQLAKLLNPEEAIEWNGSLTPPSGSRLRH